MRAKCLPIVLPPSTYARLEREARAQERDPLQQARYILRQHFDATRGAGALPADDDRLNTTTPHGPGAAT
jgi:hypothetical protein